ncbi:MAG: ATP-binding protein [Cyclobacteriaceae bacterium]
MSKKHTPEELMALSIQEMKKSVPDNGRDDDKINPKVGAILATPDGEILGTAHRGELRDGDHAEFTVLERKNRDKNLTGMVVYATLEPCAPGARNHPKLSCAERIFNARIGKVYIGYIDPDPTVAGEGRDFLKDNGIEIDFFPKHLQDHIYEENKQFFDQAEIKAKEEKQKVFTSPAKPFEQALNNYDVDALSDNAQNDMITRMSLPYKQGSEGFYGYLSDLNLLVKPKRSKVFKPTGLGMLILGRNPQANFPQSRIKFTIERENQEPFISEIEGPILLMPKKVEDLLDAAFLTEINRDGFHREELTKVSKKLLRELIINAIVHRDYTIEGAQIKVLANTDKIEIWSPGKPLFSMEKFKAFDVPSQSKNPKIAYIFYKTRLVEERNIGMKELKTFKETNNVKAPSFRMEESYFVTTIYRATVQEEIFKLTADEKSKPLLAELNEKQIKLYRYVAKNGPTSSGDYAKIIGKSDRTVRNYYKGMEKVLKQEGSGPATKYALID